jgi:hypothetical protein
MAYWHYTNQTPAVHMKHSVTTLACLAAMILLGSRAVAATACITPSSRSD